MKHKIHKFSLAAAATVAILASQSTLAGDVTVTTGFDYSTGKYGTSTSTDILYIPVIGKYETGRWTYKLTIPYIQITGPGNVVQYVGAVNSSTTTKRTTQSGLGDIVAGATYNLYSAGASDPIVDLTGKVKFGTADETKGLGTGKNDYAAQVDVYKSFSATTGFATIGYKVFGKPTGYTLNNVWYLSVGTSHRVSAETSAGMIFDFRQKASTSGAPQREATLFVSHKLDKTWKAQGYLVKGFSDGSPDWEAGATIAYAF